MTKFFSFLNKAKIYLIIVLIIGGLIGFSMYKKANTPPQLTFDTVTKSTVADTVSESGNIQTEGQANISSPIEGVVAEIMVSNGDFVSSGKSLFSVKSNATEIEKSGAYASLLAAENAVKSAQQAKISLEAAVSSANAAVNSTQNSYNNVLKGYNQKSTNLGTGKPYKLLEVNAAGSSLQAAKDNLAAAEQALANSDSTVTAAEAGRISAQENYDSKNIFTIKSTSSGTVSNISINIGDKVSPTTQTTPAMIVSQNNKSNLVFKAQINENDIAKLKVDQDASVTVDAIKTKIFNAKIKNIDAIGTNTSGVITYNVYFSLSESDDTMRPGMSGSVDVIVTRHDNALTVANAAIKPYQDGKAVQIIDETQPKKNNQPVFKYIPVKTGIKNVDRTEILDGLTEGMQVIITNSSNQFKSSILGG